MFKSKKILTVMMVLGLGASVSACNTVDGAGQDIENAGESVQDAAN